MTIGIAIVVAMILYLIDRNKVWKQAAKIGVALILLAVLGVGGIVGWDSPTVLAQIPTPRGVP
jgi:hypothetical protein